MRNLFVLFTAVAFAAGTVGLAAAQTTVAPEKKAGYTKSEPKKTAAKSAAGTVKSAAADTLVVVGKDKGKAVEWTFAVGPNTTVEAGGKAITAAELRAGDSVQVKYSEQDGKAVAQSVRIKATATAKKEEKKAANPGGPKPAEKK